LLRFLVWRRISNHLYRGLVRYLVCLLPPHVIPFNRQTGVKSVVTQNCQFCKKWLGIRLPSHQKTLFDYSHSLTSSFPQLLFALFWANFREISLVLLRFSLYSLCSQPVWYCFGIKVWYQFSEKSAEKNFVILFQ
jgi:hypothetical protein